MMTTIWYRANIHLFVDTIDAWPSKATDAWPPLSQWFDHGHGQCQAMARGLALLFFWSLVEGNPCLVDDVAHLYEHWLGMIDIWLDILGSWSSWLWFSVKLCMRILCWRMKLMNSCKICKKPKWLPAGSTPLKIANMFGISLLQEQHGESGLHMIILATGRSGDCIINGIASFVVDHILSNSGLYSKYTEFHRYIYIQSYTHNCILLMHHTVF